LIFSRLAFFVSALLHPLLLPTLCFFILLYVTPIAVLNVNNDIKWRLLLIIFILTFLAPITAIFIYYISGGIKSLKMEEKEDRRFPFLMTTFFYLGATGLFLLGRGFRELPILAVITGSVTFSIGLVTLITYYWKVSAHSVGICGVVGFILGLRYKFGEDQLLIPLIISVLMAGILMSSRLQLNAHNSAQIFVGSLIGLLIGFGGIFFFL
jgi:membrane-associated phospholipid phosphatase